MRKKSDPQKEFKEYKDDYIGRFLRQEFKNLTEKYRNEIEAFRKEWLIADRKFKTKRDYQDWLKEVEKKLKDKEMEVAYWEDEELHVLKGFKMVGIDFLVLSEEAPRIIPQGDSLKAVFDYRLRQLMRKLGVDPDWYLLFWHFIFVGEVNPAAVTHPNVEVTERLMFGPEKDEIDHRISLNIGPNTRLEDVKKVWKFIVVPLQKKMKARWKGMVRERPTDEIGREMLEMKEAGKTIPDILEEIDPGGERWDIISAQKAIDRAKKRPRR